MLLLVCLLLLLVCLLLVCLLLVCLLLALLIMRLLVRKHLSRFLRHTRLLMLFHTTVNRLLPLLLRTFLLHLAIPWLPLPTLLLLPGSAHCLLLLWQLILHNHRTTYTLLTWTLASHLWLLLPLLLPQPLLLLLTPRLLHMLLLPKSFPLPLLNAHGLLYSAPLLPSFLLAASTNIRPTSFHPRSFHHLQRLELQLPRPAPDLLLRL